jgi:hypothetical protein
VALVEDLRIARRTSSEGRERRVGMERGARAGCV